MIAKEERAFNCNIGSLQSYVEDGLVYKFYHDDWNSSASFNEFLKINGIKISFIWVSIPTMHY